MYIVYKCRFDHEHYVCASTPNTLYHKVSGIWSIALVDFRVSWSALNTGMYWTYFFPLHKYHKVQLHQWFDGSLAKIPHIQWSPFWWIPPSGLDCWNYLLNFFWKAVPFLSVTALTEIFFPLHIWEKSTLPTYVVVFIYWRTKMRYSLHYTNGKSGQLRPMFWN